MNLKSATKNYRSVVFSILCWIIISICCAKPDNEESLRPAKAKEFSFIVSIGYKYKTVIIGKQLCSATVITNKHIITAANCLTAKYPDDLQVFAGCNDIITVCDKYDVDSWITYNGWAPQNEQPSLSPYFDIAIVQLTTEFDKLEIEPVLISPKPLRNFYGFTGTLVGWGDFNKKSGQKIILTTTETILTKEECKFKLRLSSTVWKAVEDETILCTESSSFFGHVGAGGPILHGRNIFIGINLKELPSDSTGTKQNKLNFHIGLHKYREFFHHAIQGAQYSVA